VDHVAGIGERGRELPIEIWVVLDDEEPHEFLPLMAATAVPGMESAVTGISLPLDMMGGKIEEGRGRIGGESRTSAGGGGTGLCGAPSTRWRRPARIGDMNGKYGMSRRQCLDHSALMLAALMIGHHFSISALWKVASASGVCCSRAGISCPRSA